MARRGYTLLLLPFLVSAAPAWAAEIASLAATVEGSTVHARLEAPSEGGDFYVVVSHDDPLVGRVVDRILPVHLESDGAADITVEGLRSDVGLHVEALDHLPKLPTVSDLTNTLNGSLLANLSVLSQVVPPVAASGPVHAYAYPLWRDNDGENQPGFRMAGLTMQVPRLLASPAGVLSVAYVSSSNDGNMSQALARFSMDGGHRWTPAHPLATDDSWYVCGGTGSNQALAEQVGSDGSFLFLTLAWHRAVQYPTAQECTITGWTLTRIDPVTLVSSNETYTLPPDAPRFEAGPGAFTLLPDGTGILVKPVGLGLQAYALTPTGGFVPLGPIPDAPWSNEIWMSSGPSGAVFLGFRYSSSSTIELATSLDRGATWVRQNQTFEGAEWIVLDDSNVDVSGIVHVLFSVNRFDGSHDFQYVRLVPGLAPQAVPLDPGTEGLPGYSGGSVVSVGPRVWVFGTVRTAEGTARVGWESVDAGLSFSPSHTFTVQRRDRWTFIPHAAILPDGRPLVLVQGDGEEQTYCCYTRISEILVAPVFDFFPEPACAAGGEADHSSTPSVITMSAAEAPPKCPDEFTFEVLPGGVKVQSSKTQSGSHVPPQAFAPRIPDIDAESAAAATAVVAAVWLLTTEGARYAFSVFLASLFSRLRGPEVLHHTVREGMYDHIRANPGIRFTRLKRELGLSHGTAAYHLRVLEKHRLVRARRVWTRRQFFPATGSAPPAAAPGAHDVVLQVLRRGNGVRLADLARELGLSRQLVHYHVRRLVQSGAVLVRRDGTQTVYAARR